MFMIKDQCCCLHILWLTETCRHSTLSMFRAVARCAARANRMTPISPKTHRAELSTATTAASSRLANFLALQKLVTANKVQETLPIEVHFHGRPLKKAVGMKAGSLIKDVEAETGQAADVSNPYIAVRIGGDVVGLSEELMPQHNGQAVELIKFSDKDGKKIFWHSAAHLLGASLEALLGDRVSLCDGPAVLDGEGGFFYEFLLKDDTSDSLDETIFAKIETAVKSIIKAKSPFEKLPVTREQALLLFADNAMKADIINAIPNDQLITIYRSGDFVDLCRGPHVAHTGVFRSFHLYRLGGSHVDNQNFFRRIYGIAFPTANQLNEWQTQLEEAKKRDHRVIGKSQQLFFFHEFSPGSVFMLPHGTRIYNKLVALLRSEYAKRGYQEVMTPLLYKKDLWRISGHLDNYADDMFSVHPGLHRHDHNDSHECGGDGHEQEHLGLKPMNCPGHCLIFAQRSFSYKELPVRLADFSSLHRNEASGALTGLTRLRRFQQDDAHIFCSADQIQSEVSSCLDFVSSIYSLFGFKFRLKLSTRPEKYVGDVETWDQAELGLRTALGRYLVEAGSGINDYEIDVGGGAFYGPKIDISVTDAIGREHQCATVQLDFQLPKKFGLHYQGQDGAHHTPVIIHRAILGSLERFMGVLIEHLAGKWPFWLSPRQVLVCTVNERNIPYAHKVIDILNHAEYAASKTTDTADLNVDLDSTLRTVPKKVREAQMHQYNMIVLIGDAEEAGNFVTLRFRDEPTRRSFFECWSRVHNTEAPSANEQGLLSLQVVQMREVFHYMQHNLK